jgi:cytidylate kinase
MIITIDGPSGSGKSSAAKGLAARLGFEFLDTGAMFRAVGLAVQRAGVDPRDSTALSASLASISMQMPPGEVRLNGQDVSALIRTPEISKLASELGTVAEVRTMLAEAQRAIAAGRNMVCEGRDQGTVVFPDAACKFFLTAELEERGRRRWLELQSAGSSVTFEAVLEQLKDRDTRDSSRLLAPAKPAPDAIIVDTTRLTLPQVLDRLEQEVRACLPQ